MVCHIASGSPSFMPKVWRHVTSLMNAIINDFDRHIPAADRGNVTGSQMGFGSQAFRDVPRRQIPPMIYRLALSQAPFHSPDRQPIPKFTAEWYEAESAGKDITRWYANA